MKRVVTVKTARSTQLPYLKTPPQSPADLRGFHFIEAYSTLVSTEGSPSGRPANERDNAQFR